MNDSQHSVKFGANFTILVRSAPQTWLVFSRRLAQGTVAELFSGKGQFRSRNG